MKPAHFKAAKKQRRPARLLFAVVFVVVLAGGVLAMVGIPRLSLAIDSHGTARLAVGQAQTITCADGVLSTRRSHGSLRVTCDVVAVTTGTTRTKPGHKAKDRGPSPAVGTASTTAPGGGAQGVGAAPPTAVCGTDILASPYTRAPRGAVRVPAGDNFSLFSGTLPVNQTYWFAPGRHTLGGGEYSQIDPADGDSFVGAPGAVLDGQYKNNYAFQQGAKGVTIEYLTVEHFDPPNNEGAVNAAAAPGWAIEYDTIEDNSPGTGVYVGTGNVLSHNCITLNGQQGFGTYTTIDTSTLTGGPRDLTVSGNEISYNDTCNVEGDNPDPVPVADRPSNCGSSQRGCGCTAGGKFWQVDGATITDNWVHDNYSVGIWVDTDNTGFTFRGNTFADNWDKAIVYEISYNFVIEGNTFTDNDWGEGLVNGKDFPEGAVYISNSGGDSRVPGANSGEALIEGNAFNDNWGGVALYEDPDRYCGKTDDSNDGLCTLVGPSVYTFSACSANLSEKTPVDYYDGCQWKTENVKVTGNTFAFDPADIGGCTPANGCGDNAIIAVYGSSSVYPAYTGALAVTDHQGNSFADNTYTGPWWFWSFCQGDNVDWARWTAGWTDINSGDTTASQDSESRFAS